MKRQQYVLLWFLILLINTLFLQGMDWSAQLLNDARHGDIQNIVQDLDAGACIDSADSCGRTALHIAVISEQEALVKVLLDREADVQIRDNEGKIPLLLAAEKENEALLGLLADAAVRGYFLDESYYPETPHKQLPESTNSDQSTDTILRENQEFIRVYEELKECKTPKEELYDSRVPTKKQLYEAILNECAFQAAELGDSHTILIAISAGASVKSSDKHEYTLLSKAASYGDEPLARVLIERGSLINAVDWLGETPLYRAIRSGNIMLVLLLIEKGARVDCSNIFGRTPLHCLARASLETRTALILARVLLNSGDNRSKQDNKGLTASAYVLSSGDVRLKQLLTPNCYRVSEGRISLMQQRSYNNLFL